VKPSVLIIEDRNNERVKICKRIDNCSGSYAVSAPAIASTGADNGLKGEAVKVSFADLNLQKEAGAKVLYRRLQQASKKACGVESYRNVGSISETVKMQDCYESSLTSSVAKVNNALLTKIHES
jgi:UrcA family protein